MLYLAILYPVRNIVLFVFVLNFLEASVLDEVDLVYPQGCKSDCCYYPRLVWSYWVNESNMPEYVVKIMSATRKSIENFTFVFVTDKNITDFLNVLSFPPYFKKLSPQDKSCYVRYNLLERYGGVYVDCTMYVNSANELERFFVYGVNSQKGVFGFGHNGMFQTVFFGACVHSEILKDLKSWLDHTFSTSNFYADCFWKRCKLKKKRRNKGRMASVMKCDWLEEDCFDIYYESFFRKRKRANNARDIHTEQKHHPYSFRDDVEKDKYLEFFLNESHRNAYPFVKVSRGVGKLLSKHIKSGGRF